MSDTAAIENFFAEFRASPRYLKAAADDPVGANAKVQRLEQIFEQLKAWAKTEPLMAEWLDVACAMLSCTDKSHKERALAFGNFPAREWVALQSAPQRVQ